MVKVGEGQVKDFGSAGGGVQDRNGSGKVRAGVVPGYSLKIKYIKILN